MGLMMPRSLGLSGAAVVPALMGVSVDVACICPSLDKEMTRLQRDGEISFFRHVHQSATVCDQNVSVCGSPLRAYQFVIEVHRIVTAATLQDRSQTTKRCVVEHKV